MKRKTFDMLLSAGGVVVVVVPSSRVHRRMGLEFYR